LDEALDQTRERRRHLEEIVGLGHVAYPSKFDRTHSISAIVDEFASLDADTLERREVEVRTAGRIRSIRSMGKACFVDLHDGRTRVQVYVKRDVVGDAGWELVQRLDLGDHIGVAGRVFRTRTGELSVQAREVIFLVKALMPPPDPYYGLKDPELRHRQRYADLLANHEVRRVFEVRSQVIREIRAFLDQRGFLEVETPMLTPLATGAAARPFVTHHNALDLTLYARIAPELYLKRLVVGGLERVYEINRNFRNEGLSPRHNPEFTMLEFYQAYADFAELMELTREMITTVVKRTHMTLQVEWLGETIDFSTWRTFTMKEAIVEYWPGGEPPSDGELDDRDILERLAVAAGLQIETGLSYGRLLAGVFEAVAEDRLVQPTFITHFPTEVSPLSKQSAADPRFVDRFELYIGRMEIANAFSELNDPDEQRRRFEQQMAAREEGDDEAMVLDEDYLRALGYGLPPTAGEGVGVDRLVMILTGQCNIREVILFPHMRPERAAATAE
jgi:lysyl-tRNA synthetase class 2